MLRSLMTVSGLTLLSRVLGLLRDILINNYLGVGAVSDAWNAAFQFPNLFRRVFGEGAFNAAFVPSYASKLTDSKESAYSYGSRTIVLLSLILAGVFLLCIVFTAPLMFLMNPGWEAGKLDLATSLARITMGYLFFVCLLAAFSSILNSHKRFFAPAFSYAFLNMAFLGGLLAFAPFSDAPERVLAWSLLAAGGIQLAVVVIPAYKMGFRIKWQLPKLDSDMKKLGVLMLPGLLSAGIQQVNFFVGGFVVSFQEGGRTLIYNADRINQLPLGIIGIAFGVVLLPDISKKLQNNLVLEARDSLRQGVSQALFLTLPAMVGMVVLAEPMMYVLFHGGKFTAEAAALSAEALVMFALGCPAYVLARVLQPGYFARQDTKTPMKYTYISAFSNAVLCLIAFIFLKGTGKLHIGCAAATSIAGWINCILLVRGLGRDDLLRLRSKFWVKSTKMLLCSAFMGCGLWVAGYYLADMIHVDSRMQRTVILLLIISFGTFLYFTLAYFSKAMTLRELKQGFKK